MATKRGSGLHLNIVDTDKGYADLKRKIADLGDMELRVGVFEEDGQKPYAGGRATLLQVALWNEFGTYNEDGSPHIPPRPFIRMYVDGESGRVDAFLRAASVKVASGELEPEQALARVGMKMVQEIKQRIDTSFDSTLEPNAPATVKRKGFDHPLVETGQLRDAVNYKVIKR